MAWELINVPIVRFCSGKYLKYHSGASRTIHNNILDIEPYEKRNCQVCQFTVNADALSPKSIDETLKIIKGPLKCNSKIVYPSDCKKI